MIEIPNFKTLKIRHIVCDYNGTIAKDGIVLPGIKELFELLSREYSLHIITSDTFGSVKSQLEGYKTQIKVLSTDEHTKEKADFILELGAQECAAIGNGSNDQQMLLCASIGVAVLGDEGCSRESFLNADIVCKGGAEALSLFLQPKRLIATLRI